MQRIATEHERGSKMKGTRLARRACRQAKRFANFSGQAQVVRLDRLNKRYRIASRDAFRDADIRRVIMPGDAGDKFPVVKTIGITRVENGRLVWRNK